MFKVTIIFTYAGLGSSNAACCWNDIALTKSSGKPVYRHLQGFLTLGSKCSYCLKSTRQLKFPAGRGSTPCRQESGWMRLSLDKPRYAPCISGASPYFFSYLECCFWWVTMQEVAKSSHSTKEGHMMVVNRFDVHINGEWHPSSTPHEKISGLEAAASGAHFEHVL